MARTGSEKGPVFEGRDPETGKWKQIECWSSWSVGIG